MTRRIYDEAQNKTMKEIKHKNDVWFKELQSKIISEISESQAKIIDLASEKGASSWLTSLPQPTCQVRVFLEQADVPRCDLPQI